jgi:ferredoxin--NADP+ reductase
MSETVTRLEDYDTTVRSVATVVSTEPITSERAEAEVREIVLDIDRAEFAFRVGQSIGVLAPGQPEFGTRNHFRLYSVADLPERGAAGRPRIRICVRRCRYIDPYNGEEYSGRASNYLCDLRPGDALTITGPYGLPFEVPEEPDARLILIGSGTGIAPFRAFVRHLYREVPTFRGRIWLFYGARSGLELLYMNDRNADLAQYYDRETFQAFHALSPRPGWADPIAWDHAFAERGNELWRMLAEPKTYVYVAGLERMRPELDAVFEGLAGSPEKWARRKAELTAGGRWVELLY